MILIGGVDFVFVGSIDLWTLFIDVISLPPLPLPLPLPID